MISKMRVLLGFLLMLITHVMAYANTLNASKAIAITQVYGDGVRMVAVALEYAEPVLGSDFSTSDFQIDGRTVTAVFASNSVGLTDKTDKGKYLIVQLSPDDEGVSLAYKMKMNNATTSTTPK